eukprot:TRINITY_DN25970_c0_g1_i1.p1 TRINITY_DN25970_c0_g1~~TRINITY_DN25970_c0_g1_i1.p1  ORF type:complete len:297 (+),score=48.15 TRINITY_DN25970_c0_g1_i1:64-954(+)
MCIRDRFKEERRKKFRKAKTHVGLILLAQCGALLLVVGYQGLLLYLQLRWNNKFRANYEFLYTLQTRWYYMTASVIYFQACTKTNINTNLFCSKFFEFSHANLLILDKVNENSYDYPSNQKTTNEEMLTLSEANYCKLMQELGINTEEYFPLEKCTQLRGGLLNYGMRATIYYLIAEFKMFYFMLITGQEYSLASFVDDKVVFEDALVPSYMYLIDKGNKSFISLFRRIVIESSLHFAAIVLLTFIVSFILIKFLLGKLSSDLNNIKGIVALLPLDEAMKNTNMKALFNKEIHVIT